MRDDIRIIVHSAPWARAVELYVQHNGAWVQGFECVQIDKGAIPPTAFRLNDEEAQDLMDQLWKVGFRPTEGKGSAGALAATEQHLADMRRLVFDSPPTD